MGKSFQRSVDLVNSITKRITVSELIKKRDHVLLSISGGQDSICLLFVLNQISDQMEFHLALFWCHHLWQIDSFSLMRQIAKLSSVFQFDSCFAIPPYFIPSELLARNWRHNCSYRVSLFYKYSKIGLAHSANDKVETVFLNLMRGTGLTGLSPLRWTQVISKKPSVNMPASNIQEHVSQFPTFLVSPFFWSFLPNRSIGTTLLADHRKWSAVHQRALPPKLHPSYFRYLSVDNGNKKSDGNAVQQARRIAKKSKKWFYCVSYTFFKTCSTNACTTLPHTIATLR